MAHTFEQRAAFLGEGKERAVLRVLTKQGDDRVVETDEVELQACRRLTLDKKSGFWNVDSEHTPLKFSIALHNNIFRNASKHCLLLTTF